MRTHTSATVSSLTRRRIRRQSCTPRHRRTIIRNISHTTKDSNNNSHRRSHLHRTRTNLLTLRTSTRLNSTNRRQITHNFNGMNYRRRTHRRHQRNNRSHPTLPTIASRTTRRRQRHHQSRRSHMSLSRINRHHHILVKIHNVNIRRPTTIHPRRLSHHLQHSQPLNSRLLHTFRHHHNSKPHRHLQRTLPSRRRHSRSNTKRRRVRHNPHRVSPRIPRINHQTHNRSPRRHRHSHSTNNNQSRILRHRTRRLTRVTSNHLTTVTLPININRRTSNNIRNLTQLRHTRTLQIRKRVNLGPRSRMRRRRTNHVRRRRTRHVTNPTLPPPVSTNSTGGHHFSKNRGPSLPNRSAHRMKTSRRTRRHRPYRGRNRMGRVTDRIEASQRK